MARVPAASYAHGAVSTPLLGETIGANFERTVARFPDADAVMSRHQGFLPPSAELSQAVGRLARALMAAGLETGDRPGMWSPNCVECLMPQLATAKAGVSLVNINR